MKRETARRLHEATNMAFWFSNPDWSTKNSAADTALHVTRPFWRAMNSGLLHFAFDSDKVLAVNGETVVAKSGEDEVNKFMFRYPGDTSLEEFETVVAKDVELVTSHLAGIALPTTVDIKSARVFRNPNRQVDAVTQTQRRLDLDVHGALDLEAVMDEAVGPNKDRTARDLEWTLTGSASLIDEHRKYPDIARSSGNVRRSVVDGAVTLIDVMPFYEDGSRAIGDSPIGAVQSMKDNLTRFEEFVGAYGA